MGYGAEDGRRCGWQGPPTMRPAEKKIVSTTMAGLKIGGGRKFWALNLFEYVCETVGDSCSCVGKV